MDRIYLIQYKINEDSVITNRIKSLGDWVQYFDRNWIVKSSLSAKDIYEKLSVDYDKESFLIIELHKSNFWGRMKTEVWELLQGK
jgi:hypothetical protein